MFFVSYKKVEDYFDHTDTEQMIVTPSGKYRSSSTQMIMSDHPPEYCDVVKLHVYKDDVLIGRVSPNAIWLNDGDKFESLEYITEPVIDFDNEDADGNDIILYTKVLIKGPCGHYH